jgi:hypothetical protein
MRRPASRSKPRIALPQNFPAPVGGWIRNENLATPNARRPDGSKLNGAFVLENMFPTATGVRMRAGSGKHSLAGDGSEDITALFSYVNGNNRTLFAATESAIYDATSAMLFDEVLEDDLGDPILTDTGDTIDIASGTNEAIVASQAGGNWVVAQFATAGGVFLRAVNGVDTPLVYDGTDWDATPAITGSGLDPSDLSHVWVFKNRLFFVEKDTLDSWYLAVDAIGGSATKFPLGGVFTLGGSLLYGASWSLDSGDSGGLSEQCVFLSTEGEVAVYRGSDPGDADAWAKVGVYRIGRPRGPHAFIRAGGDLVIATDVGFVPLSQAIQRDYAALSPVAVSYPIETAWNEAVAQRSTDYWHCEVWPTKQTVAVALPTEDGDQAQMFVANARTGAWGLYTGWRATCVKTFGERFFFGSVDGYVIEAEVTGADLGSPYVCSCVPVFDPLKAPASLKTGIQSRVMIRSSRAMNMRLSLQHDYATNLPAAPDDNSVATGSLWGSAVWGVSVWGASAEKQTFQEWQSTPGSGYALAPALQITSGNSAPPDAELVAMDLMYDRGDIGS